MLEIQPLEVSECLNAFYLILFYFVVLLLHFFALAKKNKTKQSHKQSQLTLT